MIFSGKKCGTRRITVPIVRFLCTAVLGCSAVLVEAKTELPCLVMPQVTLTIGTPVVGVLSSVAVTQGDMVNEGDVLATLESSLEQAEVALAKAKAEMDEWCREIAPSAELRKWYAHDPAKLAEFTERYLAELADPAHAAAL